MPRKFTVDESPRRKQIIRALVRGESFAEISRTYNVSQASLKRYMNRYLVDRAAEAEAARNLATGEQVLREIKKVLHRMQMLYDACDEYLRDPEHPSRYELAPRSQDIQVVYYEQVTDEKGKEKTQRRRRTLQSLLDRVEKRLDIGVETISHKVADPRRLIIDTAATLTKQLELVAKIYGEIQDVNVNIARVEKWVEIKAVILEATKDTPEVRQKIVDGLAQLTGD